MGGWPTFFCMLAAQLSNGVANFGADLRLGLGGQALQQLCADGLTLGGVQRQKEVARLALSVLARLRGLPAEQHGCECARLAAVLEAPKSANKN